MDWEALDDVDPDGAEVEVEVFHFVGTMFALALLEKMWSLE